jgi:ubiquinone/menaquinone biosynthesis C-methylase UbiE
MESRKEKEREYFDKKTLESLPDSYDWRSGSEIFRPIIRDPYIFCEQWLKQRCLDKKILDYGCGQGIHSIFPAQNGAYVIGIDISIESIKIARQRSIREGVDKNTTFLMMDAETLGFDDNCFDLIITNGSLSYLDLQKAFSEMARVLKPEGYVIGVDTIGHNPVLNLNRRVRLKISQRTKWSIDHILKKSDYDITKSYFNNVEFNFFNLTTLVALSFQKFPGFGSLLRTLETVDSLLLRMPVLKWLAFKAVFVLSQPIKKQNVGAKLC